MWGLSTLLSSQRGRGHRVLESPLARPWLASFDLCRTCFVPILLRLLPQFWTWVASFSFSCAGTSLGLCLPVPCLAGLPLLQQPVCHLHLPLHRVAAEGPLSSWLCRQMPSCGPLSLLEDGPWLFLFQGRCGIPCQPISVSRLISPPSLVRAGSLPTVSASLCLLQWWSPPDFSGGIPHPQGPPSVLMILPV